MAIDFIKIAQDGSSGPRELANAIEALRTARHEINKVRDWMVHSNDGADYGALEIRFGLPDDTGQAVFTLIDGTLQVLDGSASGYANELLGRVG